MRAKRNTGRNPTMKELAETKRVAALPGHVQQRHPRSLKADQSKLDHINTYGSRPEYYVEKPFQCRDCGKEEIWRAADQKWFYEEAKAHTDAMAVRCHDCRQSQKLKNRINSDNKRKHPPRRIS